MERKITSIPPSHIALLKKHITNFRKKYPSPPFHVSKDEIRDLHLNKLLTGFKRLQIEKGFTLQAIYHEDSLGSDATPVILNKTKNPAFNKIISYSTPLVQENKIDEAVKQLYRYFFIEPSPAGYFEYAIFIMEMWQTGLWWHGRYRECGNWICDKQDFLNRIPNRHKNLDLLKRIPYFSPVVDETKGNPIVTFLVYRGVRRTGIYQITCEILDNKYPFYQERILIDSGMYVWM